MKAVLVAIQCSEEGCRYTVAAPITFPGTVRVKVNGLRSFISHEAYGEKAIDIEMPMDVTHECPK